MRQNKKKNSEGLDLFQQPFTLCVMTQNDCVMWPDNYRGDTKATSNCHHTHQICRQAQTPQLPNAVLSWFGFMLSCSIGLQKHNRHLCKKKCSIAEGFF